MRNSEAVTLTPPPCTSAGTILENTRNKYRDKPVLLQRINGFCKGKSWLPHLVIFWEGVWKQSEKRYFEKRDFCSPLGCPKIFHGLSANPPTEIVLPCDKRKGPTWLNIQFNNGVAKPVIFTRERKKHSSAAGTCATNILIKLSLTNQCSHPLQVLLCLKMQGMHFFLNKSSFEH